MSVSFDIVSERVLRQNSPASKLSQVAVLVTIRAICPSSAGPSEENAERKKSSTSRRKSLNFDLSLASQVCVDVSISSDGY